MRSTPRTRAWRVRWHQWWRDTHSHAAAEAFEDAMRSINPRVGVSIGEVANAEHDRLVEICYAERRAAERHENWLRSEVDRTTQSG